MIMLRLIKIIPRVMKALEYSTANSVWQKYAVHITLGTNQQLMHVCTFIILAIKHKQILGIYIDITKLEAYD